MARELHPIDITRYPELLQLIEEMQARQTPRALQHNNETVAVLVPAKSKKKQTRLAQPRRKNVLTEDDALFQLIGIGRSGLSDVSANTDKYLAEAYLTRTKHP